MITPHSTRPVPSTTPRGTVAGQPRRDDLLPAALDYAARGWHVFPLRPNDKRPAFPDHTADTCTGRLGRDLRCKGAGRHVGWEERATTDPARITRAWTATTPRGPFGIGIACGPSGLVVLDLDVPKPDPNHPGQLQTAPAPWQLPGVVDGADVFAYLAARHGDTAHPDTFTVTTRSGGTHLYYAHPRPGRARDEAGAGAPIRLGNTAGMLGWLIDTRAWGGYVVAPPTLIDGTAYSVITDGPPGRSVAPLPAWLTVALTPAPLPPQEPVTVALTAPGGRSGGRGGAELDQRETAYLRAAVDRTLAQVAAAPEGQRNRALYGAAVSLGQLVAGGHLDPDTTAAALVAAATDTGLAPGEAAATVRSGMRAGAHRPRTLTSSAPAGNGAAA